jgi:hypothetical protein
MQFGMNRVHSLVVGVESKFSKQPQRLFLLKVNECPCVIMVHPMYFSLLKYENYQEDVVKSKLIS